MDPSYLFTRRIFEFFRHAGSGKAGSLRPARMLEAAFFQRGQAIKRQRNARKGIVVPPLLIASLTRDCNLDCEGCYSKALRPGAGPELSDGGFMELFREAVDLGVGAILLAGGEPLMRRQLLEEASLLPGILLPVFTNGTLLDDSFADLAARSSLVPVLSLEGNEEDTDGRRGAGIHGTVGARMEVLRRKGALFGASVTLTSRNAERVLSRAYLEELGRSGIALLFLVEFVPVTPGTSGLVLSESQKALLNDISRFEGLPYPVVALPGDESAYGGCLAAGRGFVHLAPDGRVEACPFAPFSDSNATDHGLAAALSSPLLASIREHHGELTETSGGCALWNKSGWVAAISGCARPAPERLHRETAPAL